jgi:hypothetical protein
VHEDERPHQLAGTPGHGHQKKARVLEALYHATLSITLAGDPARRA